jgi:hypothetical protein
VIVDEVDDFACAAGEKKGKVTRGGRFLAEMNDVIPWDRFK